MRKRASAEVEHDRDTVWDTVVIGSGPGGLTAAIALARAGQRVLVVEQHYLPGGWSHSFSLEGYRFSPGVHYLGDLGEGGSLRALYEGLGLGHDLAFRELNPDGYDHYQIGNDRLDVPAGRERFIASLQRRFPAEAAGIARYFEVLTALRDDLERVGESLSFSSLHTIPRRAPTLTRWGLRTLGDLLAATIHDPRLRAFLAANCGNHGLPSGSVSLPVHAAMVCHYFTGAWYPIGGAKRIPQAYIKALRKHRGAIRLEAPVERILVEGGHACGVALKSGEIIRARNVVSNADPYVTYTKLLPRKFAPHLAARALISQYSVAPMSLFCATDLDLESLGIDSGNYWWLASDDTDGIYRRMAARLPDGELEGVFVAASSLKDPEPARRHHVLEIFTFVPYDAFDRWSDGTPDNRDREYAALKNDLAQRMLRAAENVIPGLSRRIVFQSVGSPLTNEFYCASPRGAAYGIAKTRWQVGPLGFGFESPVKGLYNCGASTLGHGLAGASFSGLVAAQRVLGAKSAGDLLAAPDGSLRIVGADAVDAIEDVNVAVDRPSIPAA